ncbi:hypothetical protein WAI453_002987 [Rhynchosporium graminicola]|uniref:Uncharacterized protein n=1 Tax=Rhynchosporium graminicola TaxID=2792576 RepID=A0A1E1K0K0_9HELO|nr:uncharacterized protein RCO7_02299 [Rhynchosporium commune]
MVGDLTGAEIFAKQFEICITIIHELAHAAWVYLGRTNTTRLMIEPYYQDEPLIELGFSFTAQIFGGSTRDPSRMFRSRGGPGLPPFVAFRENWFTEDSLQYGSNGGYRRPSSGTQLPGKFDPFTVKSRLVIPTQFYGTIMTQEMWDQKVRSYGLKALEIGPLKYGLRFDRGSLERIMTTDPESNDLVTTIKTFDGILHGSISIGDPVSVQQIVLAETIRLMKSLRISEALSDSNSVPSSASSAQDDTRQDLTFNPEDRIKTVPEYPEIYIGSSQFTQQCPRFEEIKAFLIANRAEQKLALDTMGILPEGTFYRYISRFKGITVTQRELKAFLSQCFEKKELFIWDPFPSPGMVMRVAAGWPDTPLYTKRRQLFNPFYQSDKRSLNLLSRPLRDNVRVRESLYVESGEMRDMSYLGFGTILDTSMIDTGSNLTIDDRDYLLSDLNRLQDLIIISAGAPDGTGLSTFVLGPDHIIRFTYPIEQYRDKYLNAHMKESLARYKIIETEWNVAWQAKLNKGNSGGTPAPLGQVMS